MNPDQTDSDLHCSNVASFSLDDCSVIFSNMNCDNIIFIDSITCIMCFIIILTLNMGEEMPQQTVWARLECQQSDQSPHCLQLRQDIFDMQLESKISSFKILNIMLNGNIQMSRYTTMFFCPVLKGDNFNALLFASLLYMALPYQQ